MIFLETLWYLIIMAGITFYALLDGFDLGVGSLHLLMKKEEERRSLLAAIGPLWDGNEVWLIVVFGGILAGFPTAYSTLNSALFYPLLILIFGLILRAVAIEFRSAMPQLLWKRVWDTLFFASSLAISFLLGVIVGNMIHGIPLNQRHEATEAPFLSLFSFYPLLIGLLTSSLFALHGSLFLLIKTEGSLYQHVLKLSQKLFFLFFFITLLAIAVTMITEKHMVARFFTHPSLCLIPLLAFASLLSLYVCLENEKATLSFFFSSLFITLFVTLFALSTYPTLIRSTLSPEVNSLTISNASASSTTLTILLIMAAIGLPFVIGYSALIFRLFSGKIKAKDKDAY